LIFSRHSFTLLIVTLDLADKAATLVEQHLTGVRRRAGGTQAGHSARVAAEITKYDLPAYVVIAALLHDMVEDTFFTNEDIMSQFGEQVASLVQHLTKDENKSGTKRERAHLKSIEAGGEYAVAIKLADNLDNIRTIENLKHPYIYLRYAKKIQMLGQRVLGEDHKLVLKHLEAYKIASLLDERKSS